MPGPARGWQTAGPSGKGSIGSDPRSAVFSGRTPAPCMNPRRPYAQCRTGPRRTLRRVAQASLTAPCTTLDPLRLKRKGKWCRLDRPPWHGAVTGPLADPRSLGNPLGITRCGQSVPLFQVREVISQHRGQHVLDKSASSSLRDRCVQCCDLRAGSAYTIYHVQASVHAALAGPCASWM